MMFACSFSGLFAFVSGFAVMIFVSSCAIKSSENKESVKNKSAYNFSILEEKIQTWVDSGYYDGASLVIVKDNQLIFEKYFGNYKPETQVYIASAGKWLAAAAIAAVVEEGKLTWDDK